MGRKGNIVEQGNVVDQTNLSEMHGAAAPLSQLDPAYKTAQSLTVDQPANTTVVLI